MKSDYSSFSRRKFIRSVAGAGAIIWADPFSLLAGSRLNNDPDLMRIVAKTMGVDAHNHIDLPFDFSEFEKNRYNLDLEIRKSGFTAICMTFCVDRPNLSEKGEAYKRFILELDEIDQLLNQLNIDKALSFKDIQNAHKAGRPIIIQSVEGGHFIEGKLERLEEAYNRGLRHLGLLHDNQSHVPLGDIYTNEPKFGGLTRDGIAVIKECNRLGILVDLAHCSDEGVMDALEVSSKPMLISHTGLNTQLGKNQRMAEMMMPRLISKEQAKIFSELGGVIGVWTHLADSSLEFADNLRAMIDIVGIDHVCIGTDTKMAPPVNVDSHFGKKTNQSLDDIPEGFFYTVVNAMLQKGFSEEEILKIGGGNYFRIFNNATDI